MDLDSTLVVWLGDFGRTPLINKDAGRDHWPQCYAAVLGGKAFAAARSWANPTGSALIQRSSRWRRPIFTRPSSPLWATTRTLSLTYHRRDDRSRSATASRYVHCCEAWRQPPSRHQASAEPFGKHADVGLAQNRFVVTS